MERSERIRKWQNDQSFGSGLAFDRQLIHGTYEEGYGLEKNMHIPKHRESRKTVFGVVAGRNSNHRFRYIAQTFMVRSSK